MNKQPGSQKKTGRFPRQIIAMILAVALMASVVPFYPGMNAAAADAFAGKTVQPVVVLSGQGIIADSTYTADNISNEKSYTMEELQDLEEITQLYSAINTTPTSSIFLGKGISLEKLLQESNVASADYANYEIDVVAADGYTVRFDPAKTGQSATKGKPLKTPALSVDRYYYSNLKDLTVGLDGESQYTYSNEAAAANGGSLAKTILAWERGGDRGFPETIPTTTAALNADEKPLLLMVGQQNVWEQNHPLFNKTVKKLLVGPAVTSTPITIDGVSMTRNEILMMERADRSYTYSSSGGDKTDYVRGVPLSVLLNGYGENDSVSFTAADGYDMSSATVILGDAIANNYMLAYEKGTSIDDLAGIYSTAKKNASIHGYFTLYGDGQKPAQMIDSITVTPASGIDFATSPYRHITNGGISGQDGPYDIDAITGATLTIEGPGVTKSVPLPIRELEGQNAGAHRGTYTDKRSGTDWTLQYEGIKLSYIVNNMTSGDNGIHKTANAFKVLLKNRVRQTIAEFTLDEIAAADDAGKPIIIAYGSGTTDNATSAPFVYDGATGIKDTLDNDDGPIKLVYDKSVFAADPNPHYTEFGNVAYIYVAEQIAPGYKHNVAPYNTAENSQYVLTVTGDKIGREVNYTVDQLEAMVAYDTEGKPMADGMGYRDEYSLANSSYWYVNEYEGVQLWKLLQKSGLTADTALGEAKDTLVSFTATDNYKDFDKFTIEQVSNPNLFGYYEKNPADLNDGTYVSNDAEDLRGTGYPVLVAYGVNAYPYVIKNTLDGYMSGLSNDGGPLRIISGKMNYSHANGSKQAKLLDKVIVGTDNYYSTHKYNPNFDGVYQNVAQNSTLNVKVISGADANGTVLKEQSYKVGDLEELLYGGTLTATQLKAAKIKGFYEAYKNGAFYSDLYEGISLPYFLEQVVQLPGYKGTITFSDGTNNLEMGLEEVLAFSGYNGTTKLSGLAPVIAYAKNGAPMVATKNAADGYESDVTLAAGTPFEQKVTIKNNGGPLALMFPRATADAATASSMNSITSITINLSADNYAHTELPYSSLANNTVTVSGAGTRLTTAKTFTVADIEGKQTLAVTGDYNIKKSVDSQSQTRYRGIPLYDFLSSTDIGLKPNADQVIVTCSDNTSYTFTLADVYKSDYINGQNEAVKNLKIILAYGSAAVTNPDPEDGKPLVQLKTTEAGYDDAYGNSGGPIRLVVGQTGADDINSSRILKDVTSVEVTASEMVSWNHSTSAIYQDYLEDTLQLQVVNSENTPIFDQSYTIAQLEAMTALVERENITWIGTQEWEGINLWDFVLQEAGSVAGVADPVSVTVHASDGFTKELRSILGLDALQNGIKDGIAYIPVILGYAHSGYPLVTGAESNGYVALVDNDGGPLRLMVQNNQGACLSDTVKVVVKVGDGGIDPNPVVEKDFNIYGLESGTVAMDIRAIKNIASGNGKTIADYTWKGNADKVKGALLTDLLKEAGITGSGVKVDIITTDAYAPDHYKGLNLETIESQNYLVAYDITTDGGTTWTAFSDADKQTPPVTSTVRIYRNYDDGSSTWYNRVTNVKGVTVTMPEPSVVFDAYPADGSGGNLPLAGIRSIWMDKADGLWVSTYGGGVAYKPADASNFTVYNKASTPALQTAVVSAVAVDSSGGVWMTQNASYTDPSGNQGVAYMKDGQVTYYKETDSPATIPNNYVQEIQIDKNGKVWFGSFGGLTKYDPTAGTWTTWDQSYKDTQGDSFPAISIDNINLDGNGGVWLGFYPTGAGTEADPFVGGFAHMSAAGDITSYKFNADYDAALKSSLLAQVWIRDIAVDQNGGAWVVASGSYSDLANVGGTIWYVDSTGTATKFAGDQLLGDGKLTGNSEIRMAAVDPDGGLWFGTSADGVYYIASPSTTAPLTITAQYSGSTGSWANAASWNNIYSLDVADKTVYVGSSAGLAYKAFDFTNSTEQPTVIESFTISGAGNADIPYYVGGTYEKTFKGLADGTGKVAASYPYNGTTHYVKGALLSTLLADAAVGQNTKITIKTSDGYSKASYENIPYADIAAKNYFVAYDVGEGTETLGKIADMDGNGATASFRIYRNLDAGTENLKDNRIKGVTGIVVSAAGSGGEQPPLEYDLTINGNGAAKVAQYTIKELKNADGLVKQTKSYSWLNSYGTTGSDEFEGVYLDNLLQDVVGLTSRALSITVTAGDGYYRSFNLDSQPLGVYWTDIEGNKMMLAWKKNGTNCDLQLVVGQTDAAHVNKPMWVSDIETITVNASSTSSGSGTPGNYEGNQGQTGGTGGTTGSAPITGTITKTVKTTPLFSGGVASSRVNLTEVRKAIEEINKNKPTDGSVPKAVLEIDASRTGTGTNDGEVKQVQVTLTADTLKALVNQKNITASLKTDLGTIVLPPAALQELNANSSQPIVISIKASEQVPADGAGQIGQRPVVDITITQGSQQITSLGGRQIRAGISYAAQNTENQNQLLAYYINDKGKSKPVKLSRFDGESNQMLFGTVHLSLYAVGYNNVTFADIEKHWAQKNIEFLAAREIIKGKAANVFDPDGQVTRAEFVTMLANSMDGITVAGAASAGFDDVAAAAWFADFVNWAVAKGIVSGYGDGKFGPNDLITREQMAVMADKFLQAMQADLNVVKDASQFTDQDKINSWAAASVSKMQQAGIINGRTDGSFAPQGTSTRAEAATVIKGYIEALLQ